MTEQKPSSYDQPETQDARAGWPAHAGEPGVGDPAIDALLVRLADLPGQPVSAHGEVYAGLHDELVAALNEDVSGLAGPGLAGPHAVPARAAGTRRP